ncbi:MAG: glycosyltransferase family 4 protein [Bacteroidales bacterium]|nr:glycosyltransferase family 4 protein [Bacteroidales bacterium]
MSTEVEVNKETRRRVLIIAHEFSPYQGSECAEGWNLVTRLAGYHDVTVAMASGSHFNAKSYKEALDSYLKLKGEIPGLEYLIIDRPESGKWVVKLNRKFRRLGPIGLPFLYYLDYAHWHKSAFKAISRLHKEKPFDIVHQLTQIVYREPGFGWKLDIPFVWGPTGGTSNLPFSFYKELGVVSKLLEIARTYTNFLQFNFKKRVILANRNAKLIYAFSREDAEKLSRRANGKVKIMLDAGTYPVSEPKSNRENESHKPITGLWCGQLSDRKAPSILLKAIALSETARTVKFNIIGDGPLRNSMMQLAENLKLTNINWIKEVSHDDIFRFMQASDFLIHTSLREATSNVIPEAISTGLPVICHDVNGMSIAVNETCGIKIPLINPASSIGSFHDAIVRLAEEPGLLKRLKEGSVERAREISWDKMAEEIAADYLEI